MSKSIKLTNRSAGTVGYTAYTGQSRLFQSANTAGSTVAVSEEEVRQLSYTRGGNTLLTDFLLIEDETLRKELLPDVEFEYFFTKKDVQDSLENETPEEIAERIEFAPQGVKDLYESVAVEVSLDSSAKRDAVSKAVGKNIEKQIKNNEAIQAEAPAQNDEKKPARRQRKATVQK
ncbi:MAG: hypothetical protein ACRCZZ_06090 [Phocaeicola sp.]